MIICIICGLEFESYHNTQKCCSKKCFKIYQKEYQKEYYQDNKEKFLEESKRYKEDNKEYYREYNKRYREDNKEYYREYDKARQQTPKSKEEHRKRVAKRRRNLDFNPLNNWFENSEGHHINNIDVIYIPKSWHFKGHSATKNRNMEPINTVAFFFLIMQNLDKLIIVYK